MEKTTNPHDRYLNRLREIPVPGSGECHVSLLGIANTGLRAGVPPEQIHRDLALNLRTGSRRVSDKEIAAAVERAVSDYRPPVTLPSGETYRRYIPPKPTPVIRNGRAALEKLISRASITEDADLWEDSPVRIANEPREDTALFLSVMFRPNDLLWIGERHDPGIPGTNIRTAAQWIEFFRSNGKTAPFIIVNPLTGTAAQKRDGDGETYRGDKNIAEYRYCLGEFDNITREEQLRFWDASGLPVRALVDTGGKSIHAWISVRAFGDIRTPEQWTREIRNTLYGEGLIPLGIDSACSNPSRLSRLPGHYRAEKGQFQRVLWLMEDGGKADE